MLYIPGALSRHSLSHLDGDDMLHDICAWDTLTLRVVHSPALPDVQVSVGDIRLDEIQHAASNAEV